ncbi:adenylate cyclase [Aureococcus anophagefferens]|nr:adenylate cyclase [Aureococcus anophagefferens]
MKYLDILASYVPSLVVSHLLDDLEGPVPTREAFRTVCLFCDVSGFTKLSEAMAQSGRGAEGLKTHLNSYFSQMNKIISGNGGDIFKFAGDAMISHAEVAAFSAGPAPADGRGAPPGKAAQVNLSVKIGVGVGDVAVLHVGGDHGRRAEYVAVGDPLDQAFGAEHHGAAGHVVCSKEAWALVGDHFGKLEDAGGGFVRVDAEARYAKTRCQGIAAFTEDRLSSASTDPKTEAALEVRLERYIPRSVLAALQRDSRECEKWANEITSCVVVFVNLGISEAMLNGAADARSDPDGSRLRFLHDAFGAAQKAVYEYEGSVNKFLHDDKGSTLIACWGLPPTTHVDDPVRAVLAALRLCELLADLKLVASVGITVGDVFCGVTGSVKRREYTCLGDSVNLAARLMQKAGTLVAGGDEDAPCGGVLVDAKLRDRVGPVLRFASLGEITVKGKSEKISIFHPYGPRRTLDWPDDPRTADGHTARHRHSPAAVYARHLACQLDQRAAATALEAARAAFGFRAKPPDGAAWLKVQHSSTLAPAPPAAPTAKRPAARPTGGSGARVVAAAALARRAVLVVPEARLGSRHGRVVVVEAESGCGKSAQVSAFAALASPRTAVVCFCAAKPFGETTPLGPFVAVAAHYVGVVAARACGGRHVACRALLGRPELDDDGAWDAVWDAARRELRDVLRAPAELRLDGGDGSAKFALLFRLLNAAARGPRPLVVVIDDAQHLDVASWKLAALWRSEALPGLLVLATRPLVCLPPWRARERAAAACLLGDDDASDGEADEVARRNGGAAPAAPTTIRLDGLPPEDMESDAGDDGAAKKRPSSSVVAVVDRFPLANTSRQSLTEKLNGLDVTALIVKTAALVGHAVSLPFLKDCAPPSLGGDALEDAVGDLVALGLLEVLPDAGDAVAGHDDARYGAGKKGANFTGS